MAVKREQVIRQAEKLVSRGKIEAGIREYRKVLADNPNDVSTLNRVGDLYARLSRFDDAVRLFMQIAQQYTEDGFLVKGIAIYKKIIKLDPTRLEVYEKLAELYHRQGLLNEARTQYQVLAEYYLKYDDRAAAINIYEKMAEVEPDNPAHHLKLAELYQQGKLVDKAMAAYKTIAELLLRHDKAEEAVRAYQRAIELEPSNIDFVTELVVALKDGGNPEAASRLLEAAVELNPEAQRVAKLAGISESAPSAERAVLPGHGAEDDPQRIAPSASATGVEPTASASGWGATEAEPSTESSGHEEPAELVLDLDAEPESLVQPPPDMDSPGSAFETSEAMVEESAGSLELGSSFEIDLPDLSALAPAQTEEPASPEGVEAVGGVEELATPASQELVGEIELETPEAIEWSFEVEEGPEAPIGAEAPLSDAPPAESLSPVAPEPSEPVEPSEPPEPPELPEPPAPPRVQDLMAEAEVFAKYGLEEKARERVGQVLAQEPDRLEAHRLLLDLHLAAGDHGKAQKVAERVRQLSLAQGETEGWSTVQRKLERAGVALHGELAAPPPPSAHEERVSKLLRSLGEPPGAAPPGRPGRDFDRELADLAADVLEKVPKVQPRRPAEAPVELAEQAAASEAEAPTSSEPSPPPPIPPVPSPEEPPPLPDEASPSPSEGSPPPSPPAALEPSPEEIGEAFLAPPPPPSSLQGLDFDAELPGVVLPEERKEEADLDDTGMDWLTESPPPEAVQGEERLFEDEEEFFDLAAELEEELGQDEGRGGDQLLGQPEEPSLEEIVEGFKRGVAENLSAEDFDTHYNLGIAYREMGLLDEAIGEFQIAAKDPGYLVDCCAMLGVCFVEKGLPELAIKWYQRGLTASDISEETTLSMLYDMGNVFLSMGDRDSARKTFVELYGMSSHYRDVVAKLEELGR
jgi:pilus assembly protein FimV